MRKIIIIFAFLISAVSFANQEEKKVQKIEAVEMGPALSRLHLDKSWRIKKELKFETKKITKLC